MTGKFKMSNGTEGMLRGQAAPDAFQQSGMPKRNQGRDTDHERMPVKPQSQKTSGYSSGFNDQCADLLTSDVMERAIVDRFNLSIKEGLEDGYAARMEEESGKQKVLTDAQIDEMEDKRKDDFCDLEAMRARRRQQMKEAMEKKLKYQSLGHGCYDEIEEDAFLTTVTASERCVVHFYHKMFEKCKIMDMHMSKLAKKFMGTRFVKLDSEKAPFFVEKLRIKTLPCVVVFNDGVAKGKQIGFDGLTMGGNEFKTIQLAWRIKEEWHGLEEDFGPEDDHIFE